MMRGAFQVTLMKIHKRKMNKTNVIIATEVLKKGYE